MDRSFIIMKNNQLPEPLLMQEQNGPFNNDVYVANKIIELKDEFKITHAIELGTCLGYSAEWFSKYFIKVDTVEISQQYLNIALYNRLNRCANIEAHLGSSTDILPHILSGIKKGDSILIFIDSHWGEHWPILEELKIIKDSGHLPILVIHDFFIPEYKEVLGYDSFKDVPLSLEYIKDSLKEIYDGNFIVEYNNPDKSIGAKRGVAYIQPLLEVQSEYFLDSNSQAPAIDWKNIKPGYEFKINTGETLTVRLIKSKYDYFELVLIDSVGEILTCTNREIDNCLGL